MNDVVALGTRNHSDCDRCDEPSRFIYHVPHVVMENAVVPMWFCSTRCQARWERNRFWEYIQYAFSLRNRPVTQLVTAVRVLTKGAVGLLVCSFAMRQGGELD